MSTSTRNLEELMKSQQVISSTEKTIHQALTLNQNMEGLQEKNLNLQDENENLSATNETLLMEREGYSQLIHNLNKELKEDKTLAVSMEKYLRGELKGLQVSWDSLYKDHCAIKKSYEERRQQQQKQQHDKPKLMELEEEEIESTSWSLSSELQQAELLRKIVKEQVVHPSSTTISPMEQKLHKLESENKKLKSTLVRLQTQYKEEKYKNEHISESTTSATDSSSSDSVNNEGLLSSLSVGVSSIGGLFSFPKRSPHNTRATLSSFAPSST